MSSPIPALLIALASTLCHPSSGQNVLPKWGACPTNVQPMTNFNLDQFAGKWYVSWLTPTLYEYGDRCSTLTVGRRKNDGAIELALERHNAYGVAPDSLTVYGNMYDPQRPTYGRLDVDFTFGSDVRNQIRRAVDSGYYVLGTDYKNFAVLYNCVDLRLLHVPKVLVLARCKPGQLQFFRQNQYNQQRTMFYQPEQRKIDAEVAIPPNVKQWLARLPQSEFQLGDLVPMEQNCNN